MSKWSEVDDHGHAISVSPGAKRMMTTWRPALWALPLLMTCLINWRATFMKPKSVAWVHGAFQTVSAATR
ncbi:hypothetical protein PVAP13_9KG117870 [Panicum virgatum]|uniref:Uncharacterized protein n=1 Tax=Panicum virgatum TaxID=38727 RepID=A0A8T0NLF5_PANVG|nr:hypothetical protein PVAP13_9KG117870 [Panicum virgatum]